MYNFENISLKEEFYNYSKTFTEVLEELDPSPKYYRTSFEGLDAYERQLRRFNIKVSGNNSDNVEEFFKTSETSILFPEYVRRAVKVGIKSDNNINNILSGVKIVFIDNLDYRGITFKHNNEELKVESGYNLNKIWHIGKYLDASYGVMRFYKIDELTLALKYIGRCISDDILVKLVDYILEEIPLNNCNYIPHMYDISNGIVSPDGLNLIKKSFNTNNIDITCSPLINDRLVLFDNNYLQIIISGDIKVNYNHLINKIFDKSPIKVDIGFNIIDKDAFRVFDISTFTKNSNKFLL